MKRRATAVKVEAETRKGEALDVLLTEKRAEVAPLEEPPALEISPEEQERAMKEKQVQNFAKEKPEDFAGLLKSWLSEDER